VSAEPRPFARPCVRVPSDGLSDLVYPDRVFFFDSVAFRGGLAHLRSHRSRA
jgi:hypothetical protein